MARARPARAAARHVGRRAHVSRARQDRLGRARGTRAGAGARDAGCTRRGAGIVDGASRTITAALPNDLVRPGSSATFEIAPSPTAVAYRRIGRFVELSVRLHQSRPANAIRSSGLRARGAQGHGHHAAGARPSRLRAQTLRSASRQHAASRRRMGLVSRAAHFDPCLTVIAVDALARRGDASASRRRRHSRRWLARASGCRARSPRRAARTARRTCSGISCRCSSCPSQARRNRSAISASGSETLATGLVASRAESRQRRPRARHPGSQPSARSPTRRRCSICSLSRAQKDGAGIHRSADPDAETSWFGEDVECTAYALSALMRVNPDDGRAVEIVRWLTGRTRGPLVALDARQRAGGDQASRTTSPAHRAEAKPNYRLRVEWNGETVLDRTVSPADALGEPMLHAIPAAKMKPGEATASRSLRPAPASPTTRGRPKAFVPSPGPAPPRDAAAHACARVPARRAHEAIAAAGRATSRARSTPTPRSTSASR